jgi:maltose/moltooligosaccharide transporter
MASIAAASATKSNKQKPRLSFWQIWNMSFGFLGIQFGFELQNNNISRIFETLGANKDDIPILWIAAPLTGLVVQPIIGYFSDRTWHPFWGRRRPYFFVGAVLATIALLIMPNSSALWMAGSMLWILDASINISMEPFRAFVGDKLPGEQRTAGFAMQSFFIGVGSVIAALLPWVFTNWFHFSNTAPSGEIPPSVKWSFYLGAAAFILAVMYTVFTSQESPPEDMEEFRRENAEVGIWGGIKESFMGIFKMPTAMRQLALVQFFTWFALFSMWIYATNAVTSNIYDMKVDNTFFTKISSYIDERAQQSNDAKTQKELTSLQQDAKEIKQFQADRTDKILTINLANYYLANGPAQPDEKATLERVKKQYNDGADWLSLASSVRNGVAAIFAFIIPMIAARTSRRKTHTLCLLIGGLGLLSLEFISNPTLIIVSMAMVGIAWASILSMPYAILAGSLPANKMGYYMGVFNFFIVIPQIVAAAILGFCTMHLFHGNTLHTIALGGVSMALAGLLTLRVNDTDDSATVPEEPAETLGYNTLATPNPEV